MKLRGKVLTLRNACIVIIWIVWYGLTIWNKWCGWHDTYQIIHAIWYGSHDMDYTIWIIWSGPYDMEHMTGIIWNGWNDMNHMIAWYRSYDRDQMVWVIWYGPYDMGQKRWIHNFNDPKSTNFAIERFSISCKGWKMPGPKWFRTCDRMWCGSLRCIILIWILASESYDRDQIVWNVC